MVKNPNVFISYSQDSETHKQWVLKLATDLRSHGVNAILDQWDLTLGKDLRFFMEQGLNSSSMVLCICSEKYVEKVNSGHGGAGYEGMIMTRSLLQDCNQDYIIPIVRNNNSAEKVPFAFSNKRYTDFSDDTQYIAKYQELLEHIYGIDNTKKPPLGTNPFDDSISKAIASKIQLEKIQYCSPDMDGHVVFQYENNNHIYQLGSGEFLFSTRWSGCSIDSIYALGKVGINKKYDSFPRLEEIPSFDFSSNSRTIRKGQIVIIENEHHHFVAIKMGTVLSTSHGNPKDEMEFDYHIYSVI